MRTLSSKRNQVIHHTEHNTVEKTFQNPDDFAKEYQIYQKLAGSGLTPLLLEAKSPTLTLAFCDGTLYFDAWEQVIRQEDTQGARHLIDLFVSWYETFLEYTQGTCRLGDSHFRNFLIQGDSLLGCDFETVTEGNPCQDIAHLTWMLATYDPLEASARIPLATLFFTTCAKAFHCDSLPLYQAFLTSYQEIIPRRGLEQHPELPKIYSLLLASFQVTGVVLVGGRSSRMEQEKSKLFYENETFLAHSVARVSLFHQAFLSQRRDQENPSSLPVIYDKVEDCGPMGGLVTILPQIKTPYALILPCDMPCLTDISLQPLLLARSPQLDYLCYSQEDRLCTFPLLVHVKSLQPIIEAAFARGEYGFHRLLKREATGQVLPFSHYPQLSPQVLQNVNTPQDAKILIQHTGGKPHGSF